ncbi:hypothetical protein BV20DRAFT_965606 [Pilatotrama ljubarskyi]|nr:hypothetical protein BV20DRAFT_965606 [Pilatotrama ljubarskyi]
MPRTPIGPLLKTTFESILEVFLICFAGYVLASKGIIDKNTQKKLNRLNISIFTPSLLFSKVAFFLTPAKLQELWIIPIFFCITTLVSMFVAYVLSVVLRLKQSQRAFAMAASMFMNSNSLPIALMQSLAISVPGLKWTDDDNTDAMVGRALTYLVLYSTLGMVLRWSYGVRLLSQADPDDEAAGEARPLLTPREDPFPPSAEEEQILRHANLSPTPDTDDSMTDVESSSVYRENRNSSASFESNPRTLLGEAGVSGAGDEHVQGLCSGASAPSPAPRRHRWKTSKQKAVKAWRTFRDFMTVPLWAALASLIVACIRPLQYTLDQHMPPIKGAITQAGKCSIPITLVVLGAYFDTPSADSSNTGQEGRSSETLPLHRGYGTCKGASLSRTSLILENVREVLARTGGKREEQRMALGLGTSAKKKTRPGETKTVLVAILSRMIITPLLLLPLMVLSRKWAFQDVFKDPVFIVTNALLISAPPALTLAQITQAASGDAFERLISRTIFWSYCLLTPPLTIVFVVVGLLLSKM